MADLTKPGIPTLDELNQYFPQPDYAAPTLPSNPTLGDLQTDYAKTTDAREKQIMAGTVQDPQRPGGRYPSYTDYEYQDPAVPTDPLGERQLWLEWKAAHDNALATGQLPPPPPQTKTVSPFAQSAVEAFSAGLARAEDRANLERHMALARLADLHLDPNKIVGAFQVPVSPGSFAEAKVGGGLPSDTQTVFQYEGESKEEAARRAVELEGLQRWMYTKYVAREVLATNTLGLSNIALNKMAGPPTATSPTEEVITEQILTPAQTFKARWVYGLVAGLPAKALPNLLFNAVRKVTAVELTEAVASNFTRALTRRLGGDAVRTLTRGTLREADRAIKAAGGYIDDAGRVVIPHEASKAAVQRVRDVLPKVAEEARRVQPELKLVMTQPKRAFDRFTSATATGLAGAATTAPYLASNIAAARTPEERASAIESVPIGLAAGFGLGFGIEGILGAFNKGKRPIGPIKLGEQLNPPRLTPDINAKRQVLPVPKTGNQPLDNELTGLVTTIEQRIRHFDDPTTAEIVKKMAVEQLESLDLAKEAEGTMDAVVQRNARAVKAKLEFLAEWSGDLPKLMEMGMADPEIAANLVHLGEAIDDTTLSRMATLKAKARQSGVAPRGLPEEALLDPYKVDINEINSDDITRRALAIDQAHMGATMPVGELVANKTEKLSDLDPHSVPVWHSDGRLITLLDDQIVDLTDNLQGLDLPEDGGYTFESSPISPVKFELKDGRLVADLSDTRQAQRDLLPLVVGNRANLDDPGNLLADVLEAGQNGQLDAESFAPRLAELRSEHTRQLPTIPHQARNIHGPEARPWLVKKTEAQMLTEWYEQKAILDHAEELLKSGQRSAEYTPSELKYIRWQKEGGSVGGPPPGATPPRSEARMTALGKLGRSGMKKDDWAHLADQEKADHFRIHIAGLVDEIRAKNLSYGANLLKMRLGKLVPTYANDGSVLSPSYARGWIPTAEQRTEIAAAYKAAKENANLLGSASLKMAKPKPDLTPDELKAVVETVLSSGSQSLDAAEFSKLMGEMRLRDANRRFNTELAKMAGLFNEADLAAARQVEDLINDKLNEIGVGQQDELMKTQGMPSTWAAAIKSSSMLLRVPANFFIQHIPPAYSIGPMAELSTPAGVRQYIDSGKATNDVFHLLRGNDQSGVIGKATFLHRTNQEIKPMMDHFVENTKWSVKVFNAIDTQVDLAGPRGNETVPINDGIAKALGLPKGTKTATMRDYVKYWRAFFDSIFDKYEQSQKLILGRKEAAAGTQAEVTWDTLVAELADRHPELDYVAQLMKDTKDHEGRLLLMDTLYQEGRKLPEEVRQSLELWRKFDRVRDRHRKALEEVKSGGLRRKGYVPYIDSTIREYVRDATESTYDSIINENPEVYAPFFKERTGAAEPIADMYMALSAYLPVAARKIYAEPTYYAVAEKIPQMDAPYRHIASEFNQNLMGRQHPMNVFMKAALASDWAAGKLGLPPKIVPKVEATRQFLRTHPRVGDPLNQIVRTMSTGVTLGAVNGTGLAALQLLENLNIPLQFAAGGVKSYGKGLAYTAGFGLRAAGELAREKASTVRSWLTGSEQWQSMARKRGVEEMYHEFTENEMRKNLSRKGIKRSDISGIPEKMYKLQFALQIAADMHSRATGWYSFRQWGLDNGLKVGEAEQWAKLMVDKVFGDYGKTGQSPYTKGGLNPLFFMLKRFTIGKAAEFASDLKTALPQGRSTDLVQEPAAHLGQPVVEGFKGTPFQPPTGGVEYQQAGFKAAQEGRLSPEAAAMVKMDTDEIARVWWDQKRSTLAQRAARKKLLAHPATWAMQYYAAVNIFGLGNVGVLPIIGPVSSPVLDLGSDFVRGWQLWMDPSRDSREQRELNNLVATWPTRFLPFGSLLRTQRRIQNRLNDNAGLPQQPYGVWSIPGEYWDLFTRHPGMLIFPSQSVVPRELPPP